MTYQRLVALLQFFGNKPHTLAKFLLDKGALSDEFTQFIKSDHFMQECHEKDFQTFEELEIYLDREVFGIIPDPQKLLNTALENINIELSKAIESEEYERALILKKDIDVINLHKAP